ncbi:MAG: DUF3240 family protein [Methylotenera sp.]|nr:DUF3240 family protein [Methylotenera sp.]
MTGISDLQSIEQQGLLILIVPPTLEEMLVDILLLQDKISGFTSSKVSGHGTLRGESESLSIVEQVTGRQQRIQFMMHAAVIDLKVLVASLKTKFRSSDIHYILVPILES